MGRAERHHEETSGGSFFWMLSVRTPPRQFGRTGWTKEDAEQARSVVLAIRPSSASSWVGLASSSSWPP